MSLPSYHVVTDTGYSVGIETFGRILLWIIRLITVAVATDLVITLKSFFLMDEWQNTETAIAKIFVERQHRIPLHLIDLFFSGAFGHAGHHFTTIVRTAAQAQASVI
jgi:hypothetical protein